MWSFNCHSLYFATKVRRKSRYKRENAKFPEMFLLCQLDLSRQNNNLHILNIQGDFFNWASPENVPRLAPLKNASTGPPYFEKVLSMAAGRGEIPNTLTFSIPRGGQSRTLTFF